MDIQQTGLILYTENYQETVDFYKNIFGLKTLYEKDDLTCLDFHGTYLMIEVDDAINLLEQDKTAKVRDKFCVRFNVPNVKQACKELDKHDIQYDYYEFEWGQIAKFRDPDNNPVGIRSAKEHNKEVLDAI